jgi:hypothetical protein
VAEVIHSGQVSAAKLTGGENQASQELPSEPHLPPNCGHGEPSLTPEGGWHMVLRRDSVEIVNSGLLPLSGVDVPISDGSYNETKQCVPIRTLFPDCLFLGTVVLFSVIHYVPGLGFYGDDWDFLGKLSNSSNQRFFGLFRSLYNPSTVGGSMRPFQFLYLAALYRLFGPRPLGYHIIGP